MTTTTRREILAGACGVGAALAFPSIAFGAPQYKFKCADIVSADHPLNVRLREASAAIKERTDGKVEIELFPASQLGGDADMLAQLRTGAIDFFAQSGLILSSLVPVASINGIGFAFADQTKVWSTMDGALGKYVIDAFAKAGLIAFEKMWDNGFRQILSIARPIRVPEDLRSFKIRVPPSPLWTAMFKSLGASPVSIPWGETYSAMQTRIADGLENPLVSLWFAKMYEVGKYVSTTNHMWDGFWLVANRNSFERLPPSLRDIVTRTLNDAAIAQRADVLRFNGELRRKLTAAGLQFVDVKPGAFRDQLQRSGFYAEWKRRMGDQVWELLEIGAGKLS